MAYPPKKVWTLFASLAILLGIASEGAAFRPATFVPAKCPVDQTSEALSRLNSYFTDLGAQLNFERSLLEDDVGRHAPEKRFSSETRCSVEEGAQNEVCSDVVETPISTGPKLFTEYQAKVAANTIFATLNTFYRAVDEELHQKRLVEGLAQSTQPERRDKHRPTDAVALQRLVSPRVALSQYFGSGERHSSGGPSCQVVETKGHTCERLPYDSPHSLKINPSQVTAFVAQLGIRYPVVEWRVVTLTSVTFPHVDPLWNQNIIEVALPPPQCSRRGFVHCSPSDEVKI